MGLGPPAVGNISYDLSNNGAGQFARIANGRGPGGDMSGAIGSLEWTGNTGFTAEWSLATHHPGNDNSGHIWFNVQTGEIFDRAYTFQIIVSDQPPLPPPDDAGFNQIVDRFFGLEEAIKVPWDTRDGVLRTFRLVLEPMDLSDYNKPLLASADLYVDGEFLSPIRGRLVGGEGAHILFGRVSGSNYAGVIDADWDFVRIHPGATPPPAGMACDFNSDNECDNVDIDLLAAAIRNGTSDAKFNVNGAGGDIPDDADFDFYITDDGFLSTGFGDHDLNMIVNFNDFVKLSNNFGVSGTSWDQGNGNTDDFTNFNDFVLLSNNFGMNFASGADVPEPASIGVITLLALTALRRRCC